MAETLATTVDRILRRLKRPEKEDEAIDEVNAAIELATITGNFAFDLVEGTVVLDGTVYAQSLVLATAFPRFRKMKYFRPASYTRYVDQMDPSRIFDDNGRECTDKYYIAGLNIVFKLTEYQTSAYYGYYTYPAILSLDADTHWMLDRMQACIRNLALAPLFAGIGNDAESARMQAMGMAQLLAHINDKRDGVANS